MTDEQTPVTPVTPDTPETPADDLPEWARNPAEVVKMVRELRKEAAEYRRKEKAAEETMRQSEQSRLAEQGEYKRLYEEANTQLQQLRDELKASQVAALRAKVAGELGLPPQLAERLQGDDEEAIKQDAEKLKAAIPAPAPGAQRQNTTAVPGGQPPKKTSREVYQEVMSGGSKNPFDGPASGLLITQKE